LLKQLPIVDGYADHIFYSYLRWGQQHQLLLSWHWYLIAEDMLTHVTGCKFSQQLWYKSHMYLLDVTSLVHTFCMLLIH